MQYKNREILENYLQGYVFSQIQQTIHNDEEELRQKHEEKGHWNATFFDVGNYVFSGIHGLGIGLLLKYW
jgi:hypothetical protein